MKEKRKKQTKKTKQIQNKIKKQRQKRARGHKSYSESVRAKLFCCPLKLGFLQLMCKSSLIFKLILELPLSIILKQRELDVSKHAAVECGYLKI